MGECRLDDKGGLYFLAGVGFSFKLLMCQRGAGRRWKKPAWLVVASLPIGSLSYLVCGVDIQLALLASVAGCTDSEVVGYRFGVPFAQDLPPPPPQLTASTSHRALLLTHLSDLLLVRLLTLRIAHCRQTWICGTSRFISRNGANSRWWP